MDARHIRNAAQKAGRYRTKQLCAQLEELVPKAQRRGEQGLSRRPAARTFAQLLEDLVKHVAQVKEEVVVVKVGTAKREPVKKEPSKENAVSSDVLGEGLMTGRELRIMVLQVSRTSSSFPDWRVESMSWSVEQWWKLSSFVCQGEGCRFAHLVHPRDLRILKAFESNLDLPLGTLPPSMTARVLLPTKSGFKVEEVEFVPIHLSSRGLASFFLQPKNPVVMSEEALQREDVRRFVGRFSGIYKEDDLCSTCAPGDIDRHMQEVTGSDHPSSIFSSSVLQSVVKTEEALEALKEAERRFGVESKDHLCKLVEMRVSFGVEEEGCISITVHARMCMGRLFDSFKSSWHKIGQFRADGKPVKGLSSNTVEVSILASCRKEEGELLFLETHTRRGRERECVHTRIVCFEDERMSLVGNLLRRDGENFQFEYVQRRVGNVDGTM
uniref:Uncharacterized protein n=1 Tax=Hanusia phi TaxID=3032 RepID=A0A6T7T9Q7_9CRYP|mmetsp:Transcript_6258/g.14402  ORF Transcript_6258/g.14402 Transcript_6258/m.14402 type:complete len:440 (+) Transcript_6258:112-1431(+)